jgi:predicted nucleic acid-binding protein
MPCAAHPDPAVTTNGVLETNATSPAATPPDLFRLSAVFNIKLASLGASAYRSLLHGAPEAGISGGRIYDSVIAACARRAKVQTLLTFNEAHFTSFADGDLQIIVPE